MKIVCDACQAKYSISDDKVQGKVFKIRCKKCSNIIVVRGGASAAEAATQPAQEKDTRVYDYGYDGGDRAPSGDEAVWHVVINQDQVGPMTAVDVQRRYTGGEIDSETYVWREGFADWLPLAQVDAFAAIAASSSAGAISRGKSSEVSSMFGGGEDGGTGRSDPGDLFAAASANSARHDDDGGDLFGGKPSASPVSQVGGAKLRGERNENSVLFSLNNLAQLASDKPTAATHAAPTTSAAASAAGGGEGSGLIDIRSMASAYLGGPGGSASKPASAGIGSIDDLPVFGGGGFSEPAVIVPMASRASSNKLMYALIGSVAVLAVAAVVVVVVLLGSKRTSEVAVAPPRTDTTGEVAKPATPDNSGTSGAASVAGPSGTSGTTGTTGPSGTSGTAGQSGTAGSKPADSSTKAADSSATPSTGNPVGSGGSATQVKVATSDTPADKHTAPPPHKSASSPTSSSQPKPPRQAIEKPSTPVTKADPPPAKADKGDGGGCDEVSCVLNNNEGPCCAKYKKGGSKSASAATSPSTAARSDLPDGLDRGMISEGVGKVKAQVMSCGDKSPGVTGQVKVSVRVNPDGHVTSVTVKNAPDGPGGTALGNCVAGMMQRATFAKTQTGGAFAYPFPF